MDIDVRVRSIDTCPRDLQRHVRDINALTPGQWSDRDLVVLAVPEGSWSEICEMIEPALGDETIVAHTSGAYGHEVLEDAGIDLVRCASVHPIFPFRDASTSPPTAKVIHGISGSAVAQRTCRKVLSKLGSRSFALKDGDRSLYHLACVLVSNHVVTLASLAQQLGAQASDDSHLLNQALTELLTASVGNLRSVARPADALSGPIQRGDTQTLALHLDALDDAPGLEALYRALIEQTIPLTPKEHQKALQEFMKKGS
jgi:predicted short-subunit dehydrogenase-like oxidoreductase (DUF2520 family)